jgi:hypothetical protein
VILKFLAFGAGEDGDGTSVFDPFARLGDVMNTSLVNSAQSGESMRGKEGSQFEAQTGSRNPALRNKADPSPAGAGPG